MPCESLSAPLPRGCGKPEKLGVSPKTELAPLVSLEFCLEKAFQLVERDAVHTVIEVNVLRVLKILPALLAHLLFHSLDHRRVAAEHEAPVRDIIHRGRDNGLDARIDLRRADGEAAASADADDADLLAVYARFPDAEIVHRRRKALREQVGRGHMARLAAALPHIDLIEGQHDKAALRQLVRVNARALLLDTAVGRADDQRRVLLRLVQLLRCVNVGGNGDAVAIVVADVLARDVLAELSCR